MNNKTITRFNWIELKNEAMKIAEEDYLNISICEQIVLLVELITAYRVNHYTKKQYHASLRLLASKDKPNFLLNALDMLMYTKASVEDKCLFIFLASKRNYSDYALKGISYIPYALVEETLNTYDWKNNPLLSLEGDCVYFKITEE